jgi:phage terminase large subunit
MFKVAKLTERIMQNKYFIHPSCKNTIMEFEKYRWKERRNNLQDGNEIEEPEKSNDHMMDALGDLHVMYDYDYKEPKKLDSRIPGTYVKPLEEDDEGDFTSETFSTDEW